MKSPHLRSAWTLGLLTALTAAALSLATERAALADEAEGPLPNKVTPAGEPEAAPLAAPSQTLESAPVIPALPAATPPLPAPAPVAAPAAAPAPVVAPVAAPNAERDVADAPSPVLQPWDVDTRAALHTTPLFQYGGVGASADAGMRRLGPGTVSLGGGMDYFFCGTSCTGAPLGLSQRQLSFEGRVSYHMAMPKVGKMDFYPLVTAGFMVSRASIKVGDGSEYRASDVAPTVGFGAGASYFFTERFFVGAEVRFRYATGTYSYELASGPAKPFDHTGLDTWNSSTVDIAAAVGARF